MATEKLSWHHFPPHILSNIWYSQFSVLVILMGVQWYFIVVWIFISLMKPICFCVFAFIYIWRFVLILSYEPHMSNVEKYSVANSWPNSTKLPVKYLRGLQCFIYIECSSTHSSFRPVWFYYFVVNDYMVLVGIYMILLLEEFLLKINSIEIWWVPSC